MSHQATVTSIGDEIRLFEGLQCSGGKLFLGSMFYLDFGRSIATVARGNEPIVVGEMTLSVRDVAWWFFASGALVASAETVTSDPFARLVQDLVGVTIVESNYVEGDDQLELRFSRDWRLLIDLSNMWASDQDILELALPDGRIIVISKEGELLANSEGDPVRANYWAQLQHHH